MLPTTIVRFEWSSALRGYSVCWLLLSFLGSFYHSKAFDEAIVAGRRGRADGPKGGNEAQGWTSAGLPSFLLSSATPHTPSLLEGQWPPTASDDSRSPSALSVDGGDERGQTEEGDEPSLVEDGAAAASHSDDRGQTVEGEESSLVGDGVTWGTTDSYPLEEAEVLPLAASALPLESRPPARRSRKLKRESKKRISRTLVPVLTAATLLGALLVYRKSRQRKEGGSEENPSGRASSFSTWLVGSGVSQKRWIGAVLLAGVILIVAAVLTIDFAGTGGPDVRADGEITSSTSRGVTAPSESPVSSTSRLVEIEKSVTDVRSNAPMSAVAAALAVITLSFLVMRLSQVRGQTEDVGEADLGQMAGEAESADEGRRQEDYEEADGANTAAEREGTEPGADADVVVEKEKEKETGAEAEEAAEGAAADEREEQPQMEAEREAEEAKTIAEEEETKADERDKSEGPDVPSKAQGEEESGTDTARGQEAQKAPESFIPYEVPSAFDSRAITGALPDEAIAQARSGKHRRRRKLPLNDYPAAVTKARREIGKLKSAIENISPELYGELEEQLRRLKSAPNVLRYLEEREAHLTLLSRMVQVEVVEKNLSAIEEWVLQGRFRNQFTEFCRHVGGQQEILRHIESVAADDLNTLRAKHATSLLVNMSGVLEVTELLETKAQILLEAIDLHTGDVYPPSSAEHRRRLQEIDSAISDAKQRLSELNSATPRLRGLRLPGISLSH